MTISYFLTYYWKNDVIVYHEEQESVIELIAVEHLANVLFLTSVALPSIAISILLD